MILIAEGPSPQFLGGAEQAQTIFSPQEEVNLFLIGRKNLRDREAPRKPVERGTAEFTVETTVLDIPEIWDAKVWILKQTQIFLEWENTGIDQIFNRFDRRRRSRVLNVGVLVEEKKTDWSTKSKQRWGKKGLLGRSSLEFSKKIMGDWVMDWIFLPPYFKIFLSLLSCFSSMIFSLDLNEDRAVQCGFSGVAPRNGFGHWIDLCPNFSLPARTLE